MKRIFKNSKAGFSLTEILLVVAILVILVSVFAFSVSKYLSVANSKSSAAAEARASAIGDIQQSEARMATLGFGTSTGSIKTSDANASATLITTNLLSFS